MSKLLQTLAAHRRLTALAAVLFAAGVVAAGLLYLESKRSRLTVGPGSAAEPSVPSEPKPSSFTWPTWGYDSARSHFAPSRLEPPFTSLWKVRPTGELLEFPPSLARGRLYVVENEGRVIALSARTGRTLWKRDLGQLAASTPAYQDGRLYVTILCLSDCAPAIGNAGSEGRGRVAALDARTGKTIWSRDLPSRTESSPLVVRDRVFFGAENGKVYALQRRTGRIDWTHQAADAVKSALAYDNGRLYFGDYAGAVTALRARDGELVWSRSNVSPENFYGTPAVGFGRVFLSTTDGKVHALRLNGNVDWRFSAGPQGYIYASPALAKPKRRGPTVYIGAHDSRFYALDARTGRPRWSKRAAGKISGTATVLGDYVYFSTLDGRTTYGVRAPDGKEVFRRRQGAFNPAIADERRVYLIGYSTITALEPGKGRRRDAGRRDRSRGDRAERSRSSSERRRRPRR
jgi:outer membrane protein assembly factor BamB